MEDLDNKLFKMSVEIIPVLIAKPVDEFYRTKLTILAEASDDKEIYNYMSILFDIAEAKRPLLIVMKGGTV